MNDAHLNPTVRHDAVLLFDVTDGNPNGDPDAGNQPRVDDHTSQGLVSDVAIKRKIRNTVALAKADEADADRYGIFVEAGHALNTRIGQAKSSHKDDPDGARAWMCQRYFDVRMFGAVLSTGDKESGSKARGLGNIYGPTQLTFARSLDAVHPVEHTVTRVTQTRQQDIDKGETTEIGRKWTVPYGLYRADLYYSAARAAQTGVDGEDLNTLWHAITVMFDHDRSAARGQMKLCGLYVFSHPNKLGNAPAHELTKRVTVSNVDPNKPARSHHDYRRDFDRDNLPGDVVATALVDVWT